MQTFNLDKLLADFSKRQYSSKLVKGLLRPADSLFEVTLSTAVKIYIACHTGIEVCFKNVIKAARHLLKACQVLCESLLCGLLLYNEAHVYKA